MQLWRVVKFNIIRYNLNIWPEIALPINAFPQESYRKHSLAIKSSWECCIKRLFSFCVWTYMLVIFSECLAPYGGAP